MRKQILAERITAAVRRLGAEEALRRLEDVQSSPPSTGCVVAERRSSQEPHSSASAAAIAETSGGLEGWDDLSSLPPAAKSEAEECRRWNLEGNPECPSGFSWDDEPCAACPARRKRSGLRNAEPTDQP
jgi:hypothetical protein